MANRPSFTRLNGSRVTFTIPPEWFVTISAVSRRTYRQNVLVDADRTIAHLINNNGATGSMHEANFGLLSFPLAPRLQRRQLDVFFSFTTGNRELTMDQLRSPEFSSHTAVVRSATRIQNSINNVPEYVNYFVFVADTPESAQVPRGVQFDDMLLILSLHNTNTNEIPPPPPDNVIRPYNPILDLPWPGYLENYLKEYHVHFLIDDSGSMGEENRWVEANNALVGLTHAIFDAGFVRDGIDLSFLNAAPVMQGLTDREAVAAIFRQVGAPTGGTPTGQRVSQILNAHIDALNAAVGTPAYVTTKPFNLIVITDGVATDALPEFELTGVLVNIGARLAAAPHHPNSLGVQFVQIGSDARAAEALPRLVAANTGHIVDTVPWLGPGSLSPDRLERILLGALHPNIRAIRAAAHFRLAQLEEAAA